MQVLCETEYTKFHFMLGQRPLDMRRVQKIEASMKDRGFVQSSHITVDKDFNITDGQHRFQAARNAGLPIYYVVDDAVHISDVQQMGELAKAWHLGDYLYSFASQGNSHYVELKQLINAHNISIGMGLIMLKTSFRSGGNVGPGVDFRSGNFKLLSDDKEFFVLMAHRIKDFINVAPAYKSDKLFILALRVISLNPHYDHQVMIGKMEYLSTRFVKCASRNEYVKLLQEIYNYKTRPENKVDFTNG